ncbi:MAG: ATP-binding protein [Candidatus Thermoplasmatota archaeon]|nr:ATP-binding protein [Candidatus Thermoplasmatota archaeon]
MENPFDYQRIVVGESFVDREKELKALIDAVLSGENILLYSPRRYGKSSLLKEAIRRIGEERISIYVDLWECLTEVEIAEKLASGIINAAYNKIEKAATMLKEGITSARPLLTIEKDGSIGIKLEFIEREKTLRETIMMIQKIAEKRKKKVIVVMDECQVIAEFKGHRIEKVIRSTIQEQSMVTYIFSGSKQHVLEAMVNEKSRAFYKQLRPMTLGPIPIGAFTPFIKKGFSQVTNIDDDAIAEIYRLACGNPQRIQQICHWLFSKAIDGKVPTPTLVKEVVVEICLSLDKEFEDELDGIKNRRQRQILKALSIDPTEKPMSMEFIQKHALGPASSVQTALKGLIEKGVLDNRYEFVDPLFKVWLLFKHRKMI